MSHLSEELTRQLKSIQASVDDITAKCNISRGQIYKWIKSEQTSISAEQLDALASALSSSPMDHAKLLVAHLQDERIGAARHLVRIELDGPDALHDKPRPKTKGEKAIHFLAEQRVENRSVNDLVIDLARVLGADV